MLHVLLLRHAKSSWVNPEISDFDRPINKRGKRAAKAIGAWLAKEELNPDRVLSSSARRTRETWEGMKLPGQPDLRKELYHAGPEEMLAMLQAVTPGAGTILMIGHNPGVAELAHMLVAEQPDHPRFDDYPTGALLVAGFDVKTPAEIAPGSGQVVRFLTPHDLLDEPD
ncbi:histidine phosphatase family protein [Tropicimonas sp. IMCC34043]|uniref:SixA phosphatase family protein n=1 Tax=Tropicimonas sp. IMCC34043 TaxID=2248760 RepID=UPI000E21ED0C|nr:histidine phosphatase family protein [Tropicimonas sp. IMCC34043]